MDRLDRLTQRLAADLDRGASSDCLALAILEDFATGRLDARARERVDAHLDDCLACLDRFVELRDSLQGVDAPGPVAPRLRRQLERLIGTEPVGGLRAGSVERLRRAFVFRVPAWAVAGMAAALVAVTWMAASQFQRPGATVEWPFPAPSSERLTPVHRQIPRTISGVVSSIRDATANGVEAHVVSLKDAAGATYVLFTWGPPTVRPGEPVEIDGIFTSATQSGGLPVYQGVATEFRRAR